MENGHLARHFARRPLLKSCLLDFDLSARRFHLFLNIVGFLLGHALLDWLGSPFNQRLGFGQPEPWHGTTDLLDHANLIRAHLLQDAVERGLFFTRRSCRSAAPGRWTCRYRHWRRRAYTPFFFELFYQSSNLEHR